MADVSRIKLPSGNTYDIKDTSARYDIEHFSANDLAVLQTKTYTNVTVTGNSDPAGWLYFFKVVPTSATTQAYIRYRVTASIPGVANNAGFHIADVEFVTFGASVLWYKVKNADNNTNYRPFYNHIVYRAKAAGITGGYGHLMGLRFQSAYEPANASYKRTITIDILETRDCTATFFDSPILYANAPGTGSTNYDGRTEYNGTTQGDTHSGDSTNIAELSINYTCRKTKTALYRYMILLTYDETYLLPVNSVDNSTATTKTLTTEAFDPFGTIMYYPGTTTYAADANLADWMGLRYHYSNLIDYRYSFNTGTTLTARKAIYLVCVPQSNGKAKLASTPISQTLPTTDDGNIYIYLGKAYDTYRGTLEVKHPIYYYKNNALRIWTNASSVSPSTASIGSASGWSAGTATTLGTAISADDITSWTTNTPTKIDTTKFSGGSFTRGTFSGGSFTQGTDSFTKNVPTKIDTTKFSGGSFTRGTFSGGSFTQGTDSFTANTPTAIAYSLGSSSATAANPTTLTMTVTSGVAASFTQGTDSFTAATHAADSFTAASLASGFYTAGTSASFTQGTDSFTAATHSADSFTAASLNSGFYTAGSSASLAYTSRSIPNVTSAGTVPSLTITSTTVVTGIS